MSALHCPHPCQFRLRHSLDRGWGELAFEYVWESTSGKQDPDGTLPDLDACFLYEFTTYDGNAGERSGDRLLPPCPPFDGWSFRDPTDGRTGPVGMERFAASQGWAWDRHKLVGGLIVPTVELRPACDGSECNERTVSQRYEIVAVQRYCFHCERCGTEAIVSGPDAGPHSIQRAVTLTSPVKNAPQYHSDEPGKDVWRYSVRKHGVTAWLDWNANGYVADSANIGFGPSSLNTSNDF